MNPQEFFLGAMAGILLMGIVYVIVEAWRTRAEHDIWGEARGNYEARIDAYQARFELYDEAEKAAIHEKFMAETEAYIRDMDGVT